MKTLMLGLSAVVVVCGLESAAQARGVARAGGGVAVGGRGGVATGGYRGGTVAGPRGVATGGARGGSYTTPGGTTIQGGRVGGAAVGPLGGVHAGGASGARVTTPSGNTYTTGQAGRASVGPRGGVSVSGGRGTIASGPGGTVATGARGGAAVGPYGGVAVGGTRGGAAVGRYGGATGVRYSTSYISPATLSTRASYVRTTPYYCFTRNWYTRNPAAWAPARWAATSWWVAPRWGVVAPYCGVIADTTPLVYDYGSTIVYNDNRVYYEGVPIATAEEYAGQAADLAQKGKEAAVGDMDEFQPLGVFGLIQDEEKTAQHIVQLAINKAGVVRGNYYNALTDQTTPLYGSLDKKSQRVAWSVGDKKDIVFEAGLSNLTQPQTTAVIHYGKERTIQMTMVRLEEPTDAK